MARDLIGPALPPGFKASGSAEDEERDPSPVAGPALPPNYKSSSSKSSDSDEDSSSLSEEGNQESEEDDTGPTARKQRRNQDDDDDDGDEGFFGPALPPGFKKQDDSPPRPIIGPALPPGFLKSAQKSDKGRDDPRQVSSYFNSEKKTGSSEEEDIIGPMPAKGPVNSSVTTEFEKRAQRMKEKLTKGDDDSSKTVIRDSWMTELPPELKNFGLGPRTFKRRADDKSGDRSVWTDMPADRERKAKETPEARKSFNKKDEEHILTGMEKRLAEQVSAYNESKRPESLMDIHQKKLKNKAAEDKNKPQERIPFNRDTDLKVHRFDEAQKKALIKKSRELNTRFSHGKGNMFL
ncbi:GPALPP motifs-containing protein 1 [Monodon monoceros]|uniref:GPALPP motifs-containing protein 1 n=2 Tax=Monodontidae TaxID=9747 RepID=A0A2Y9NMN3_DELLE|nr:GPALPP motifs-containing protein 1 isoform X1 [Delphinapterus leucas]XP_022430588.1 GPALPP motifs-containing protein 1 isoform X1 [Delphinapterus leucas]XP_029066329.1 GPALPP motifs-containing protein 1 [Monodon monoceros]XP_029066330.1 GPALPP motifs-containing protein 1 [Monodon monoceros]XP_029066331.1 GPALPP motifs-containing protein 1 [Monodon monoceros]